MKKFICLFVAIALAISSCSSDKNDSTPVTPAKIVLPTKRIISIEGESPYTITYVYDGYKRIQSNYDDGTKTVYTYTGDLITKTERYLKNNVLNYYFEYIYENGKLTTIIVGDSKFKNIINYFYKNVNTVDFTTFGIDVSGNQTVVNSGKYTVSNGNIIREEALSGVTSYEYDNKFNSEKNITGYDKILGFYHSRNNLTKETIKSSNGNTTINTSLYKYNSDGYPTEVKGYIDGKLDVTVQYFY